MSTEATTLKVPVESFKYTRLTVSHLEKYPVYVETMKFLSSFALVRYMIDVFHYYVYSIANYLSKYSYPVEAHNNIDSFIDAYILDTIDSYIPALKTFKLENLKLDGLYKKTYETTMKYYDAIVSGLKKRYESVLNAFQSKTSSYTSSVKPTVEAYAEPVLKPINNTFEYVIDTYLPAVENEVSETAQPLVDEASNELAKFQKLSTKFYDQSKPIVSKYAAIPANISKHVSEVYTTEKKEGVSAASVIAHTSRRLSDEAYTSLKPTVEKLKSSFSSSHLDKLTGEAQSYGEDILREAENIQNSFVRTANGSASSPIVAN